MSGGLEDKQEQETFKAGCGHLENIMTVCLIQIFQNRLIVCRLKLNEHDLKLHNRYLNVKTKSDRLTGNRLSGCNANSSW